MGFLRVRNPTSKAEYDAPEELVTAFPDEYNVLDPEPVLEQRPPKHPAPSRRPRSRTPQPADTAKPDGDPEPPAPPPASPPTVGPNNEEAS